MGLEVVLAHHVLCHIFIDKIINMMFDVMFVSFDFVHVLGCNRFDNSILIGFYSYFRFVKVSDVLLSRTDNYSEINYFRGFLAL